MAYDLSGTGFYQKMLDQRSMITAYEKKISCRFSYLVAHVIVASSVHVVIRPRVLRAREVVKGSFVN